MKPEMTAADRKLVIQLQRETCEQGGAAFGCLARPARGCVRVCALPKSSHPAGPAGHRSGGLHCPSGSPQAQHADGGVEAAGDKGDLDGGVVVVLLDLLLLGGLGVVRVLWGGAGKETHVAVRAVWGPPVRELGRRAMAGAMAGWQVPSSAGHTACAKCAAAWRPKAWGAAPAVCAQHTTVGLSGAPRGRA